MFNPFLPGNLYKGHRQTAQTQIRCHNVASDQGLHCLLTEFSIKNRIKVIEPAIAAMQVFSILVTVQLYIVTVEVCRLLTNEKQRKTDCRVTDQ